MNIKAKHLSMDIHIEDDQTQRIYLHLWQKALEFNLKGMIHVQEQIITAELEGAENTLAEVIRVVQALTLADKISITMDKPLIHYTHLATNVC